MLTIAIRVIAGAAALGAGAWLARAYAAERRTRGAYRMRDDAGDEGDRGGDDWMASAADVEKSPSPRLDDESANVDKNAPMPNTASSAPRTTLAG